jgi:hypothetical protein
VVCNACQSARVRAAKPGPGGIAGLPELVVTPKRAGIREEMARNISFAEAFLRGGISNYVGTHWPVEDAPAKRFAEVFYTGLTEGRTMGEATRAGRGALEEADAKDWADYIHYGDPNFVLKVERREATARAAGGEAVLSRSLRAP